ncbi:MAG: hypothetical protein KAU48_10535, partial [Candidatus Thorarchaeota archaeon]|nr:hypothetical protein [Candidatus Thorarchaeota archaeon]
YAEDNAGNWGVSTTEDYTVSDPDTVGPTIGCSQSPSQPTEIDDVIVTATVTDETGVVEAVLEYKVGENTTWEEVIMEQSGAQWSAPIPHQAIGVSVQYRVKARDISNNWATSDTYSYIVEDANPPPTALEVFAQYVPLLTAVAGIITVTRGYIWWKARKNGKSGDYDSIPDGLTRDSDGSLVFSEEPDDGSPLDD